MVSWELVAWVRGPEGQVHVDALVAVYAIGAYMNVLRGRMYDQN